jgi:hypothetical protein
MKDASNADNMAASGGVASLPRQVFLVYSRDSPIE